MWANVGEFTQVSDGSVTGQCCAPYAPDELAWKLTGHIFTLAAPGPPPPPTPVVPGKPQCGSVAPPPLFAGNLNLTVYMVHAQLDGGPIVLKESCVHII